MNYARTLMVAISILAVHAGEAPADQKPVFFPNEAITEFFAPPNPPAWSALALGPEGNIWFTASNPGRIERISQNGVITGEFVPPSGASLQPDAPEGPSEPENIALGPNDEMWFTDTATNGSGESLVGYVTPIGQIREFPIPAGNFASEIALGPDNNMWFTESGEGQIGRVTESGIVTLFKLPASSGEYSRPIAIAQGGDGNMWATKLLQGEHGRYTIDRITPAGVITGFPIPVPYRAGLSIALGPDGNMWFTQAREAIGRITPAGAISEFQVSSVGEAYNGLVTGVDGDLWFTESANTLGRLSPVGVTRDFLDPVEGHGSPIAITRGRGGYMWYSSATGIGRLQTPLAPVNEIAPPLSGDTLEGQTLSVGNGTWLHNPSEFKYQWQICDALGSGCTGIVGEVKATHLLQAGDIGHTLRGAVTASDDIGEYTAVSVVSAVVRAAPRSLPPVTVGPANEVLPVIGAGMTWKFGWTRTYTIVESLAMHNVPSGSTIDVTCRGRGCKFAHWRSGKAVRRSRSRCRRRGCRSTPPTIAHGAIDLTELFGGRQLKVGTRIVVGVSKAKWIGKEFAFTILANKSPRVKIACMSSSLLSNPGGAC